MGKVTFYTGSIGFKRIKILIMGSLLIFSNLLSVILLPQTHVGATSLTTPAKPVINSPTFKEDVPISEIYDSASPRRIEFVPDTTIPGVKTVISVSGEFEGSSMYEYRQLNQATDGNYRNLKDFAPGTAGQLKYKVGNIYTITARSVAYDADGNNPQWSGWASDRAFIVTAGIDAPVAPTAPTNLKPADGSEVKNMFTKFSWDTVAGATSYDVDISLDSSFATLEKTYSNLPGVFPDSEQPFSLQSLKNNQNYYWRVRANNAGGSSDWTVSHFTTNATNIGSGPVQINPINGEIVTTADVLLEWENDPIANSNELGPGYDFLLEVSKVSDFSTTIQTGIFDAFDSSVPIFMGVEDDTTYFWRVRIFTDTKISDWSTTSFRVQLGDDTTEPTEPITPSSTNPRTPESTQDSSPRLRKASTTTDRDRILPVDPSVSLGLLADTGSNVVDNPLVPTSAQASQDTNKKIAEVAGDSIAKPFTNGTTKQTKPEETRRNNLYTWLILVAGVLLVSWRLYVLARKKHHSGH